MSWIMTQEVLVEEMFFKEYIPWKGIYLTQRTQLAMIHEVNGNLNEDIMYCANEFCRKHSV